MNIYRYSGFSIRDKKRGKSECRRQDSNLRTVTDWDLIPAPLTKLGDSCADWGSRPAYINTATEAIASFDEDCDFVQAFPFNIWYHCAICRVAYGHDQHGFFMSRTFEDVSEKTHRGRGMG